ncbi:hypothetical protein PUN28_006045 [Cardiocondyla obscurior]|uniref:Uncharacterized protein n=1 Tax=Cardiocondyla obscurior TaxID=286306 RepID=A0AAW2GBS3_9HYME
MHVLTRVHTRLRALDPIDRWRSCVRCGVTSASTYVL